MSDQSVKRETAIRIGRTKADVSWLHGGGVRISIDGDDHSPYTLAKSSKKNGFLTSITKEGKYASTYAKVDNRLSIKAFDDWLDEMDDKDINTLLLMREKINDALRSWIGGQDLIILAPDFRPHVRVLAQVVIDLEEAGWQAGFVYPSLEGRESPYVVIKAPGDITPPLGQ